MACRVRVLTQSCQAPQIGVIRLRGGKGPRVQQADDQALLQHTCPATGQCRASQDEQELRLWCVLRAARLRSWGL